VQPKEMSDREKQRLARAISGPWEHIGGFEGRTGPLQLHKYGVDDGEYETCSAIIILASSRESPSVSAGRWDVEMRQRAGGVYVIREAATAYMDLMERPWRIQGFGMQGSMQLS